ncbi:MAG: hypothetical protein E6704_06620 [Anaerococcus prevotii]|nr:hypothetical protein [Anaerococcus prevotii]
MRKPLKFILDNNYRFIVLANKNFYNRMDDKEFIQKLFKFHMSYSLNLDYPKTFNEKLHRLKLYDRRPEYTKMVDKYKVREYISEKLEKNT